jgi:hypothetical protein
MLRGEAAAQAKRRRERKTEEREARYESVVP